MLKQALQQMDSHTKNISAQLLRGRVQPTYNQVQVTMDCVNSNNERSEKRRVLSKHTVIESGDGGPELPLIQPR
jgi:hypothetical protein